MSGAARGARRLDPREPYSAELEVGLLLMVGRVENSLATSMWNLNRLRSCAKKQAGMVPIASRIDAIVAAM